MQPGYPGSGQDPYNQQPPSDPFGGANYGQYPAQPDPYAPQSGAPYQQPDPYNQGYPQQPVSGGQPYDPYQQQPGQQPGQPPYYPQQPASAPPVTGYPPAPGYQAPVVYPGATGYTVPGAPSTGTNALALTSMILGIVAIPMVCCFYSGILFGIVAVVLGFLGLQKANTQNAGGKGFAIAGLVCGGVGALLGLLFLVLYIAGVTSASYT